MNVRTKEIDIRSTKQKKKFFKFLIDLYSKNPHAAPNLYADEMGELKLKLPCNIYRH